MITILFGKSASGKDSLLKKMVSDGYEPIVSYTTRPMRTGEIDGVDYHFIDKKTFDEYTRNGVIFESRSYDTLVEGKRDRWYYGSPSLDVNSADYVGILDIDGVKSYLQHYGADNIIPAYVMVSDEDARKKRAQERGSFDETEWNRRFLDDQSKFSAEALRELRRLYERPILVFRNDGETIDDICLNSF